jgi:hypothetical protein
MIFKFMSCTIPFLSPVPGFFSAFYGVGDISFPSLIKVEHLHMPIMGGTLCFVTIWVYERRNVEEYL